MEGASGSRFNGGCYCVILLSLLAHIYIDAPAYNAPLAVLGLIANATKNGMQFFITLIGLIGSFGVDIATIVEMSNRHKHHRSALLVVSMLAFGCVILAKLVMLVGGCRVFARLGGIWSLSFSSLPLEGDEKTYASEDRMSDLSGIDNMDKGGNLLPNSTRQQGYK
eukprot:gb/GECG01015293.1/.p1 GENE.gb/GECG01015293.1/~~gb/GECG01015293.1/.p1  ORF type:complete len:166 (+),score=10.46 gb/GECG01015293.1/:1-498(+)